MADEKSPARISHRLFAIRCSEMDNMMVSNTTEARELALVADTFNMEKKDVKKLIMNGVEAAFTTEGIKNRLRARVETQFAKVAGIRG